MGINAGDNRSPTMANLLRRYVDQAMRSMYTMMPGRVESFDPDTQTAAVQPLFRLPVPGASTGPDATQADLLEDLPIIPDVPVKFLRTKYARITARVDKGSFVMLVFSMYSLEKFSQGAGVDGTIDPQDTRHHALSDAVAIPGLYPGTDPITDFNAEGISIVNEPPNGKRSEIYLDGTSGDVVLIPANGAHIQLGEAEAKEAALLGETAIAELETMIKSFTDNAAAIVATGVGPGSLNPAVVTAITVFISKLNSWLTQKVKVT